jgi:acetyltransferase-like isoleucine patch superfamily enzyme
MQACLLPPRFPALCSPLTSNRQLGDCPIANIPLRELISTELSRAGFQLVDPAKATDRTLRIPVDNWLEVGALMMLGRVEKSACLTNSDGEVLAWKGSPDGSNCAEKLVTSANCFTIRYPWDLLRLNEEVLALMDESSMLGEVGTNVTITGVVRVGKGTRILPGSVIEGPVLIGPNCHIGPNSYIRGATTIGANSFIGSGAEVKNSVLYNNAYISRQCYVGDSIIGTHVTLGAGTCTENHRHDGRHHLSMVQGKEMNTGRTKLGAIIGDGVKTGVNTSIEAGVKIGIARTVKPGTYVAKDLL